MSSVDDDLSPPPNVFTLIQRRDACSKPFFISCMPTSPAQAAGTKALHVVSSRSRLELPRKQVYPSGRLQLLVPNDIYLPRVARESSVVCHQPISSAFLLAEQQLVCAHVLFVLAPSYCLLVSHQTIGYRLASQFVAIWSSLRLLKIQFSIA